MGFCYNKRQNSEYEIFSPNKDRHPSNIVKKKSFARKKVIPQVYAERQRHTLSARDLNFLKSIGLRIRQ